MPNPWFQFKQFTVWHDKCAMKVGTDGVLLGAWADIEQADSVLDVGTGSGLIALMIAQRNPQAAITAIDIEASAITQANENFQRSPWQDRLKTNHLSLEQLAQTYKETFDAIVTNPPYFHQSLPSPDRKRTLARHTTQLTPDSLLLNCRKLLSANGSFHLILPFVEGERLLEKLADYHFFCTRKTYVCPTPSSSPKRLLICLKSTFEPILESTLTIENGIRHHYSDEYASLTQAFYLKSQNTSVNVN